ncbi:glycerate kinase [Clostridium saccharobutylicum]|uniref:Glycerate kinase GlxK n=1 Tax=Clostridium saccharobutylicum DSM 13864 TaxID=1345695 RepID=U5MMY7_CLOSA|nr:glycerate kinase [Clostridium saccharobutylicum]AGX42174.1 glycerate kinase GlxK [Clostridium saccharobutylicum DSM 13864]AQR89454.1 glycerate 2-kinase [Clostridium saccharobutylicum]AQR99356.1 glycerate 2-kinase [Clostridium saccharobutylicum]AQS09087.1 glycerate 2-kinase [Clostridium saccharobutylicum]AQS13342.1 glycerate 2-kinase [Clostridium saccharobutylicum]
MKKDLTIVLAPDSFKESMTAKEACEAMERGIKKVNDSIKCIHVPMADGGEGTMQSLVDATNGKVYSLKVVGPLGNEVEAQYGILGDGDVGVLEMASASGIHLVSTEKRNPLLTTTYGTGQLIKACLDHGVKKLLIGIGGSATNDGGAGVIQALGVKLLDKQGNELSFGGGELGKLNSIDLENFDSRLKDVVIEVACDVNNPLCGEKGASNVFGPQKGATKEMIGILDNNLKHYADIIKRQLGKDVLNEPGAGAAGGLGAGLMAFLDGTLKKGIEMVIEYASLEEKVKDADMVWTGEGSIDFQTQYGKTPLGVATVAKKYNKPVIALAGRVGEGIDVLYEKGIDSIFGIMKGVAPIEEALANGQENIEKTAENIIRLMNLL